MAGNRAGKTARSPELQSRYLIASSRVLDYCALGYIQDPLMGVRGFRRAASVLVDGCTGQEAIACDLNFGSHGGALVSKERFALEWQHSRTG